LKPGGHEGIVDCSREGPPQSPPRERGVGVETGGANGASGAKRLGGFPPIPGLEVVDPG